DGVVLFNVRGISAYPSEIRATTISTRIQNVAADYSISPDSVNIVEAEHSLKIYCGGQLIMNVFDIDGKSEHMDTKILARIISQKISATIVSYRHERSRPVIMYNVKKASIAAVAMLLLVIILLW